MTNLTERQREAYGIILEGWRQNCPPTIREIAAKLKISNTAVVGHVTRLEAKGLVQRDGRLARTLVPTSAPSYAELEEALLEIEEKPKNLRVVRKVGKLCQRIQSARNPEVQTDGRQKRRGGSKDSPGGV